MLPARENLPRHAGRFLFYRIIKYTQSVQNIMNTCSFHETLATTLGSIGVKMGQDPCGTQAASLNSTRKRPVSTSKVKRRLQDAGLLARVAKKKPYLRLANKKKRLRWGKEHRHWTEELCLEGQHPDNAGPIVHRLMGLPVTACCETAWDQTQVSNDTSSTAMLCH
jgi:hypothetical protein